MAAIRQGAAFYKQAKESLLEVKATADEIVADAKAVRSFWQKLFSKPATKPVAQKKKEKFVAYTETQAASDIVKQLTEFWFLQDQLNEFLRAEEEKAKVYNPNMSNAEMMGSAMNRILCQQQMAELEVTIREIMVYETSGLSDLYTQTFAMRGAIKEQQEQARLRQEAQNRQDAWLHREKERNFQLKVAWVIATFIFLLYLWLWLALVRRWRPT